MSLLFDRITRLLLVLALLPTVVLGTTGLDAILIHSHHGEDVHLHAITLSDSGDHPRDWSCEHEPHDWASDQLEEHCSAVVLTLELPDVLPRVRGRSTSDIAAAACSTPSPVLVPSAITTDPDANSSFLSTCPGLAGFGLRADNANNMVAGILLTNHTLLL